MGWMSEKTDCRVWVMTFPSTHRRNPSGMRRQTDTQRRASAKLLKIELIIECKYASTRYQITNAEVRRKLLDYVPELKIVSEDLAA